MAMSTNALSIDAVWEREKFGDAIVAKSATHLLKSCGFGGQSASPSALPFLVKNYTFGGDLVRDASRTVRVTKDELLRHIWWHLSKRVGQLVSLVLRPHNSSTPWAVTRLKGSAWTEDDETCKLVLHASTKFFHGHACDAGSVDEVGSFISVLVSCILDSMDVDCDADKSIRSFEAIISRWGSAAVDETFRAYHRQVHEDSVSPFAFGANRFQHPPP